MKKIVSIILIALICMYTSIAYAADISDVTDRTSWNTGETGTKVTEVRGKAIGIMQAIGASVAIIMLITVGIKYLTSAPEDRAQIKSHLVVYVVGALLIFGASTLLGIVYKFIGSNINNGLG